MTTVHPRLRADLTLNEWDSQKKLAKPTGSFLKDNEIFFPRELLTFFTVGNDGAGSYDQHDWQTEVGFFSQSCPQMAAWGMSRCLNS